MSSEEFHQLKELISVQAETLKNISSGIKEIKEDNKKQWDRIDSFASLSGQVKGLWVLLTVTLGASIKGLLR